MHRPVHPFRIVGALALALTLTACGRSDPPPASGDVAGGAQSSAAATPAPASAPAPAAPFDLTKLPISQAPLPPFPYLEWPAGVPEGERRPAHQSELEALTLIAGDGLLTVEGRLERRAFALPAGLSQLALRRDHEQRITGLGGVKINGFSPVNADNATFTARARALAGEGVDVAAKLGLARYDEGKYEYEAYALRTPDATVWFVVQTSQYSCVLTVVLQKPVEPPESNDSTPS